MSAQAQPRLTPEQYLEQDRTSEFRNEYYNGRMYVMAGGTHRHAIIMGNTAFAIRRDLGKRPCLVTTSDLRVCVAPQGFYAYPDVVVVCNEPKYVDKKTDTLLNPVLVIEILSSSTEAYDRGFKATQYRRMESLQEYAFVSQDEPRVEVFRRQPSGDWLLSESAVLDAACKFDSVGCVVPLADVYDKVTFAGDEEG